MNRDENAALGIGEEDIAESALPPDYQRGAGGAPKVRDPENPDKFVTLARTSSLGDALDSKDGLINWKIDRAVLGVAKNPDIAAAVVAAEDERSAMASVRERAIDAGAGKRAADLGTALHRMTERWEQEPEWDPGEPYRTPLEAYTAERDRLGLVPVMFEAKMVNHDLGCAGTFDRKYQTTIPLRTPDGGVMPPDELVISDFKTGEVRTDDGDLKDYGIAGYCVQSAGYAGGQLYDVVSDEYLPTPPINQDWGMLVILSLERGTCEFLWVDLEVGRTGAALANEVREWRRAWRRKDGFKAAVVAVEPVAEVDGDEREQERVEPIDLSELNKPALVKLCQERGIEVPQKAQKADLLSALIAALPSYICPSCNGRKWVWGEEPDSSGVPKPAKRECGFCNGTGLHYEPEPQPEVETSVSFDALGTVGGWREQAKQNRQSEVPTDLTEALRKFAVQRVKSLRENEEVARWAVTRWPKGLPSPKQATTVGELLQANKHLDEVEKQFGLPFPEGDPRPTMMSSGEGDVDVEESSDS